MNIKKYSLKTMCAALACTTIVSSMFAAYATDVIINETPMDDSAESVSLMNDSTETNDSNWTTEEKNLEDITVTYKQSSSYFVTIPKTIALGVNKQAPYAVKVTGDIDTKQRVYVAPVDGITETGDLDFYMKEKDNKKEDVVAKVTQNKTYWSSEDVANAYEATNNSISAPNLTAGTWEGTFQMEIRLETDNSHTHNFVDGKCECGKEIDPYEIAPESESSRWNYTLDDENDIITLNWYSGIYTGKEVIVYANYVVNGKTYKTQIKSNDEGSDVYMFSNSHNYTQYLESIKFSSSIDTSNITNMDYMFYRCEKLTSLDISCFDTSNVTSMVRMFSTCSKLTSLDISSFDTSKVTNMYGMFGYCASLTDLDVSNFDTSNVTNMYEMFRYCRNLTSLDLSSFDTSNVTNMTQMFYNSSNLKTIYVTEGKWSTSQVKDKSNMFYDCGTSSVTYK